MLASSTGFGVLPSQSQACEHFLMQTRQVTHASWRVALLLDPYAPDRGLNPVQLPVSRGAGY